MALQKAGINLTIQGEAQYIAGLRNVNREMDLMATNTKLAVAQLGMTATPTQKFNTQMRHMGAEIEKASVKTIELRNRNKELPNTIFETGKSLDKLKDKFKEQGIVQEALTETQVKMRKQYGYQSDEWEAADKALKEHTKTYKETEKEVKALEAAYNGMLTDFETMPNQMAEAQLATQKLLNEQAKLREEYLKGGGVLTGFADKLQSGGEKLQKYGRHVSDLGDAFMGVTVGILAGGGGALKAFMDWETALRGAMKTTDEIFDSNGNLVYSYQDLEDGLRGLSKEIPVTSVELAEFAEIAGRLQVPTDEVVEFTEVVAKLGETTNLSGEEAAEQLGKFINITGASTSSTLNLANALVELGNNTAASEQETLRMSTRWASTGDIIGMTDDQILALSASVISLGIRTEAGGSAVQRAFLKINDAVLEGGDTLASFAELAGMSSSEFQKAWQEDAAYALIPFLEGLHETHEAGGNVNQVLRDLGITSVNELNTLLVLAGGYDQLAGNLKMASDAYNETEESMMALNKEAELAYGTTLGKLRTAWNRLKDSLIDIGEPIADAVLDMVDAAEPLFETIENIATGFSEMDESAQRDIINTVGKIALIAPALKIAGGAMSTLGDISLVSAGLTRKAGGTITKAMLDSSGEVLAFGGAAQTAAGSKGVGGLITSLAGSAGLPWALGIAAVALGGWTLWKTWGEDAWEAAEQTRKWGTVVGETANGILGEVQEVEGSFGLMAAGIGTNSDVMVGDFQKIGESIENDINARLQAMENYLNGMPEHLRNAQQEILADEQERLEDSKQQIVSNNEEIARIQQQASNENRKITTAEVAYLNEIHKSSLDEYLGVLNLSTEEERNIRAALSGDIENIQTSQVNNMIKLLMQEQGALDDQKKAQLKANEEIADGNKKMLEALNKNTEDYYAAMGVTGQRTLQDLVAMNEDYIYQYDLYTGELLAYDQQNYDARVQMNKDLVASWTESHNEIGESSKELAEVQEWMVDGTKRGAQEWNRVVMESGGELETFREKMIEATSTTEGWNAIKLQIHNADLDSNAKAVIMEAAIMNGEWDSLEWGSKIALLKDNFSITVYQALERLDWWNEADAETKSAVLLNEYSDTVIQGIIDIGKWDSLTPEQQELIATTNTPITIKQTLQDLGLWESLEPKVVDLLANNTPVMKATDAASRKLDEYGNIIVDKPILDANKSAVDRAVEAAQRKINSLRGKTVTLTSRHVTVGSPSGHGVTRMHARGTNHHPGGLAVVNDQQGASFRELVTLPSGESFIPSGRDVLLDLPKGSKVLRAALTKMKFPDIKQYQDGVGYSRQQTQKIMANNNTDMSQTNNLLITLIDMVRSGQVIQMDGNEVGRTVYSTIDGTMTRNMQRNHVMNMQGG